MRNVTLAVVTAAAVAASTIIPTGFAYAAPASTPHVKPLICLFLPTLQVCIPPKPVMHHHAMMKPKKP